MPETPAARRARQAGAVAARLALNLGVLARDGALTALTSRVPRDWIELRLERGLVEVPPGSSLLARRRPRPGLLQDALDVLARARGDARVQGVLLHMGQAPLGWAKVAGLARGIQALRAAGKRAVVYAEHGANACAWLGALADRFWMAPEGRLDLVGVRLDSPFLREALDRFHVRATVLAAGRYKSAGEMFERSSHSPESREALDDVADELYSALRGGLAARAPGAGQAARWIDEGPYLASQAREAGLVDALLYPDELRAQLAALTSGAAAAAPDADVEPEQARVIGSAAYLRLSRPRFALRPLLREHARIPVVPLLGMITAARVRPVVRLLERLRKDASARAVVLRIDSGGGDATASDAVWHAVQRLVQRKPVVASMGDTAASGGYYAAMAASEIVAEATTLTGSIGVVMVAPEIEELLTHLGVRFDAIERGRHAGIYALNRTRSDEERAHLRRQVERIYASFVQKAAASRELEPGALEQVAQGRVWTGRRAFEHGLVDALGGLDVALERARALAGLEPGEGEVVPLDPSPGLLQRVLGSPELAAPEPWPAAMPQLLCPVSADLR